MSPNASRSGTLWNFLPLKLRPIVFRLGFSKPTPVQEECLTAALEGVSFAAVAPTGTGKTLVYLLPIWKSLPTKHRNLVLVPTRELGYQVSQMLQALDPIVRAGIVLCMGGHDSDSQRQSLQGEWHTLIATPGRLLDMLESLPALLKNIRLLVLDEFDRLIDLGFEEQIGKVLAQLPVKRQTLLFSATGMDAVLDRLPLSGLERRNIQRGKSAKLTECFYFLKSNRKKNDLLLEALKERKEQSERALAYQGFKEGRFQVLVATDLAGRGLDLPEVDLVVNYDLPRTFQDYIHRSGRTARRSRPGSCISFVGPDEYLTLRNLEKGFDSPLPNHPEYAQRDRWLEQAKRLHEAKVAETKRAEFIRREQGL